MTRGLSEHFKLTLLLNFKNRQALIYGYLVPFFFLVAFAAIFRSSVPPLIGQLGQILTITVLGGACFGMPTAMVGERERGIWRRYRLLPAATGSLVITTMMARYLIVVTAAVMQIVLAKLMYGMPMPKLPAEMIIAFSAVTFAFLGMGLVIAMLADAVPAVQALGQAIFLPMIIIGGVGVPLGVLPIWARHVAVFLPGTYAVNAIQSCANGEGLASVAFDLAALIVIGIAGCIAGGKMFRWDAHEKLEPRKKWWALLALLVWLSVGATAEMTGRAAGTLRAAQSQAMPPPVETTTTKHATWPTTERRTWGNSTMPMQLGPAPGAIDDSKYVTITPQQIDAFKYDNLPADDSTITPVANDLSNLNPERRKRMADLRKQLDEWPPAKDPSLPRRVRNLFDVASIADIAIDADEGQIAYVVFQKLKEDVPREELEKVLAWISLNPADAKPITTVPELGIPGEADPREVQNRVEVYSAKLLGRLTGKIKAGP